MIRRHFALYECVGIKLHSKTETEKLGAERAKLRLGDGGEWRLQRKLAKPDMVASSLTE